MTESKPWEDREIEILLENLNEKRRRIVELLAAEGYDRTIKSLERKTEKLRANGEIDSTEVVISNEMVPNDPAQEIIDDDVIVYPSISRQITQSGKRAILRSYVDTIQKIKKEVGLPKKDNINALMTPEGESIVIMLSDLHIGKEIINEDGDVLFNTSIAMEKIASIKERILTLIAHARSSTNIDEIVVLMIGDMVDNESIYDSQAHHIDSFVAEQVKNGTKALWDMLVDLSGLDNIKQVRVCCVRGNHGRTGGFGHEASNWDNVVYDNLELVNNICTEIDNISINTNYANFNSINVRGHKILIRHEAPVGADTSAQKAKYAGWFDVHKADAVCYGHFHHWGVMTYNDRPIFRNGSLPGADDLAERIAVTNSPAQMLYGVTEKRIPSFIYPITFSDK